MTDRTNTTAGLVADLRALTEPGSQSRQPLKALPPRGPQAAKRGRGDYVEGRTGSGGGGIASPLTVQSVTYADQPQLVETIDGSGLFRVKTISSIQMVDADGNPVVISGFGTVASTGGE